MKWLIEFIDTPPKIMSDKAKKILNNHNLKKLIKSGKIKKINRQKKH